MKEKTFLRIAGNTETPCYYALIEKGYNISFLGFYEYNDEGDGFYEFTAHKEGQDCIISATSMYELLALVTMGEIRGFNHSEWKPTREEIDLYFQLKDNAPCYDKNDNLKENE